jgi:micrococcal nuclease
MSPIPLRAPFIEDTRRMSRPRRRTFDPHDTLFMGLPRSTRRLLIAAAVIASAFGFVPHKSSQPLHSVPSENHAYAQDLKSVPLLSVVDGDTVYLKFPYGKESVRLIGIDTPESRENQRAHRQAEEYRVPIKTILSLGKAATRHLDSLLPRGSQVSVIYDEVKRDKYGRLLAYLIRSDGTMLNEQMIVDGFAAPLSIKPNTRHAKSFTEHAERARRAQKGIWQHLRPPRGQNGPR